MVAATKEKHIVIDVDSLPDKSNGHATPRIVPRRADDKRIAMPKILYLASEDWFFVSHFLPAAVAARDCCLDVVVAGRIDRQRGKLEGRGFRVVALPIRRERFGPVTLICEIFAILMLIWRERPDIVHCLALRMVILGGIACRIAGVNRLVLEVTGLGTLWVNEDVRSIGMRAVVRWLVRRLFFGRARLVFENHDDPREFGLDSESVNVAIVPGSGVDPEEFQRTPEPAAPPVKFAVVARMLRSKGIAEAVAAARKVRSEGGAIELHLFGDPDPTNRDSCVDRELRKWTTEPGIFWHGHTDDVVQVWRDHHVALLLSYREGLPRMLLEAAASGRPIIASDVPGCRELVRDGVEGFLVPAREVDLAAGAIRQLAVDQTLRRRFGDSAYLRFQAGFSDAHVREKISALYQALIPELTFKI
jgi:glycosyltransferase involved in cell wall biosynthesis